MTSDEMVRYLQNQFGDIGDINAHTLTAEERSNRMDEGTYNTYGLSNPALMRQTEFGRGLSNVRPGTFSPNRDPLATEYGIIPNEHTATPTSYRADLTAPDQEGYYYTADYTPEGKMIGDPKREKYEPDFMRKYGQYALALPLLAAAPYAMPGLFAAEGATAAALGELGINTALAAGTPGGIASGLSAASLGELGINTALAPGAQGGIASGTALSGVEAAPSFFESLNLGKTLLPDAPSYVQQGVNRFGTGLITSGGDPEAAARSTLMGGVSDFINPYFAELPKEFQPIARAGVQTALQGGDLKGFVGDAIFGPINDVVSGIAGPTVAQVTSNAVKQAIATGSVDPANLTVGTIAGMVGQAVTKETGDASLGRAVATTIRGAAGGNLDNALKQLAIGALTTPTKRG